ncbi:MAG: hypothetical protein AAF840_12515 [Bacteroidota bacterium]
MSAACERQDLGDRLFEVTYPVTEFAVLGGQPTAVSNVIALNSVPTSFLTAMNDAAVSADDIDLVGGFRARVVSLTNDDFSEMERIEVRACAVGTPGGCTQQDILFSQSDLFRRRQQTVDLSPSLLNFKELFVGSDFIRVEVVFFSGITTSRNLEARLDWSVAAFGNLN